MFELIPAIDVLNGEVVRLERGDYNAVTVYRPDPVAVAEEFIAAGAPIVHVVDLEGARRGVPEAGLRRRLAAGGVPFQVGGGLRSVQDVATAVNDGAARVVVGTTALWDSGELRRMLAAVGPSRLIAAVDVSAGRAKGAGWLDAGRPLDDVLADLVAAGVERVLATAIVRDGMMTGPDLALLNQVAGAGLAVIASGGVGTLDHLRSIAATAATGAIVGRAIYEGRFSVADAIAALD